MVYFDISNFCVFIFFNMCFNTTVFMYKIPNMSYVYKIPNEK